MSANEAVLRLFGYRPRQPRPGGRPPRDLRGLQRGRLRALRKTAKGGDSRTQWLCICECGRLTTVRTTHLTSGHRPTSCGQCRGASWKWWM